MARLKRLSGPETASIFQPFGFILSQCGSPIKLRRLNQPGEKKTLTNPNHWLLFMQMVKRRTIPFPLQADAAEAEILSPSLRRSELWDQMNEGKPTAW